ncbi:LysR family substrate-binding domain-containing protein [Actinoallomurus iriomotensis]|uniref:LysR substrate-binding domain-containing protein n=1 Tax=Actinoallomurus iriomotensis TaxID=478107 RepID=A0A9W6W3X7_9ACTN|nr:LysR family substrate-binding domain-containing protein [Actinoallomurus iriomotensis]GLY90440.1 hypothetical protein Airi02_083690 [Actinoallomurus iriomotensis]
MLRDEGRAMLRRCGELTERVRAAGSGRSGRLRVAYTRSAADLGAQRMVREFRRRWPDVEVATSTGWTTRNVQMLAADETDVAFVRTPVAGDGLAVRHLADEELAAVLPAAHPLARRRRVRPEWLRDEAVILWPRAQGPGFHDRIVEQVWPSSRPNVVLEEPEAESILAAVADGLGVAVLDHGRARKVRLPGVVVRRFTEPAPTAGLGVAWRANDPSPTLARLLASL